MAVIGLVFLTFLSTCVFTCLTGTTSSISSQNNHINSEGNLHDFTINELYNNGSLYYTTKKVISSAGEIGGSTHEVFIPKQVISEIDPNICSRTYEFDFDKTISTGLYKSFYEIHNTTGDEYYDLLHPTIIVDSVPTLEYLIGTETDIERKAGNVLRGEAAQEIDSIKIDEQFSAIKAEFLSVISTEDTPMQTFLNNDLQNQVEWKSFKSIDINNSHDNVFYKVIQSNPTDSIDKIVQFKDDNGKTGWNNFNTASSRRSNIEPVPEDPKYDTDIELLEYKVSKGGYSDPIAKAKFDLIWRYAPESFAVSPVSSTFAVLGKEYDDEDEDEDYWNDQDYKNAYDKYFNVLQPSEFLYNKGYRYTINWQTTAPSEWYLDNWTSKFAVVNPEFMTANDKLVVPKSEYENEESYKTYLKNSPGNLSEQDLFAGWMNAIPSTELEQWIIGLPMQYKISVDSTEYVILGCGITPDFIYPIISSKSPIPNPKKEALVYSNTSGYQRIEDAFRTNWSDKYLVGVFKPGVNKQETLNEINQKAQQQMIYPLGTKAAYFADDTSNLLNSSAYRIAYIPDLISQISFISYLLTSFVIILGLLICGIIIRRFITNNRVVIGVMQANGISKNKIATSLLPFAAIPAIIGGVIGYIIGLLLQPAALGLFASYWMLPTVLVSFSWISLFVTVILPFLVFACVSYFTCYLVLRIPTVELMKSGSEFKSNLISRCISKSLVHFGVITRFRISLAFNTLWKLVILCSLSMIAMTAVTFNLATLGKYDQAKVSTFESRNYNYAIDLITPTNQGGQYYRVDLETANVSNNEIGFANLYWDDDETDEIQLNRSYYLTGEEFNEKIKIALTTGGIEHGNLFVPFAGDTTGQGHDLLYLKNRSFSKLTLDYVLGLGIASTNPWNIAVSLMPENTRNTCDSKYKDVVNYLGALVAGDITNDSGIDYHNSFKDDYFFKKTVDGYSIDITKAAGMTNLKPKFIELLTLAYTDPEVLEKEYFLNYNTMTLSPEDETYTYLSSTVENVSSKKKPDTTTEVKIMGIKPDTDYLKLTDEAGTDLSPLLIVDENCIGTNSNVRNPIIINAFAAQKYNLQKGDEISFNVSNKADRIDEKIAIEKGGESTNKPITFTVVGINTTYQNEEYFIDQNLANYILGLKVDTSEMLQEGIIDDNFKIHNYAINYYYEENDPTDVDKMLIDLNNNTIKEYAAPEGFNGYFTNDTDLGPGVNNTSNLYSESGLWAATDSFTADSESVIGKLLVQGINLQVANIITGINDPIIEAAYKADPSKSATPELIESFLNQYISFFGTTSLVSLVSNVIDKQASELVFNNMAQTAEDIQKIIIAVVIPMALLIVLLMTSLLVSDSRKMAGMLKALGYSDTENTLNFLSIYLPVILIGLAIAIPLTIGLVAGYQLSVFIGASILLTTTIYWWYFAIALIVIMGILGVAYMASYFSLKRDRLIDVIK